MIRLQQDYEHINFGQDVIAKEVPQKKNLQIRLFQYLLISISLIGLIYLSFINYLLFHTIIELFSVIIAFITFVIAINTTKYSGLQYGHLVFLGIALGITGAFDLLHTVAYKGMGVFSGGTANPATELWIASRYLESIALFITCVIYYRKNVKTKAVMSIYIFVSMMTLASILIFDIFPDCYIEGYGLTGFKKISEVIISAILFAAAVILHIRMIAESDRRVIRLIIWSLIFTICSEVTFIFYIDVFGILNMLGHVFKVISFYLIYKAIVKVNLESPFVKLRQSEKQYSDLCASLPESVLIYAEKRIAYANKAASVLFGSDSIDDYAADIFDDIPEPLYENGPATEKRLVRRDGSAAYVEVKYIPYNYMGEQAVLAVLNDISDRKRAEEEARRASELQLEADMLRKKEQEYLEILDGSTEASWIYDFECNSLKYSHEWKKRIGGENVPDDEMELYVMSLLHPDDMERAWDRKALYDSKRTKYKSEYRFKINEDKYIWVYDQGKIVYNEKGVPVKVYGTSMDITERKKAEEALRASESNALALVQELKQLDKNKNGFLSALSHELRNPLASIVLGLSILEMSDKEEQKKKTAETIKRQVDQMCHLVDDLLHLTRITQNRIEIRKENIEFSQLAASIVEDFRAAFEEKGIALISRINSDCNIDADPVRVKQAIGNLLNNSLKFTDAGGEVMLSVYRKENSVVVSVEDNGIGIRTEFLPKVFEPFTQADESLARTNGGLGLGLSIVKGIAELHGGSVSVYSEGPCRGSEFLISFPA